ncbi:MAG: carotenoid biosynthesis protein [Patescibacteria group bacterium]
MKNKTNLVWKIFFLLVTISALKLFGTFYGINLERYGLFKIIFLSFPVLLLLFHSIITLLTKKAIFFILLASTVGFLMERLGLKTGTIFGGHYVYRSDQLAISNVPLSVVFYWAVFIYTGYCVVTSFLYWSDLKKPNIKLKNFWLVPLLVFIDGLVVTAIDLFMDPLQVKTGSWTWLDGGPYFGVPIGNFIGWFIVTVMVTGLFRTFEYFFPTKKEEFNKSIFIVPVLGYGFLALSFALSAIKYQMLNLAIIGSLLMLPTVILNLFLFFKQTKRSF